MLVLAGPRPDHQGWRGWKSRAPLDNLLYIIDTVEPSSWNRFPNQNLGLALSDSWKQHSRTFSAPLLFNRKSLKSLQSGYLYHTWVDCSSSRFSLGLSSSLGPAWANISLLISSSSWQISLACSALPGLPSSHRCSLHPQEMPPLSCPHLTPPSRVLSAQLIWVVCVVFVSESAVRQLLYCPPTRGLQGPGQKLPATWRYRIKKKI